MSHYTTNPAHCRVDIFKPSGKWYCTVVIDMSGHYNGGLVEDHVRYCLLNKVVPGDIILNNEKYMLSQGYMAVCLEPYHEHSHPVMIR